MNHARKLILAFALGLASVAAMAADNAHRGHEGAQAGQASSDMADGEVKKIDKSTGKITIKHGPLAKLEMGSMTMVFRVSDPKMLEQVKAGDKIRFDAQKINGALTVTKMDAAK